MIEVQLRGLESVEKFYATMPQRTEKALRLAINSAALFGARLAKKEIMSRVNLKSAYIGNPADPKARLAVTQKARAGELVAVITARHRPTSLARFATSPVTFGKQRGPVRVSVGRGTSRALRRGFFIKLKRGKVLTADAYNLGIAYRLKPGEEIKNKNVFPNKRGRYAILYGPSIEQLFNRISVESSDEVLNHAEREFLRQFDRLKND